MSKFIREVSMTLFDDILVHTSTGVHSEVEFNFQYCWRLRKHYKPQKLTMIHVHPDDCAWLSDTDRNMVKGWATAFWIPIVYITICKQYDHFLNKYNNAYYKSIVKIENNRPVIYDTLTPSIDVYNISLTKEIDLLIKSSRNFLLKDFYFYMLDRKRTQRIQLAKLLL